MTTKAIRGAEKRVQITPEEVKKTGETANWYEEKINIPAGARCLLEQYSGIAPDQVVPHVKDLRERAFKTWPYPCIGQLRFLELTAATHPTYPNVVSRVKSGQTFLDVGCCLGQDLRKLMSDGAPSSEAMYGIDIESAFFHLGYELFRDREKMHATFLAADLTAPVLPSIESLESRFDIISAQSFFHLFTLEDQVTAAIHLARLTKPIPGSIIVGRQLGLMKARETRGLTAEATVFLHNPESFTSLWQDVGAATDSKWKVDTEVGKAPDRILRQSWAVPGIMFFVFTVTRQ